MREVVTLLSSIFHATTGVERMKDWRHSRHPSNLDFTGTSSRPDISLPVIHEAPERVAEWRMIAITLTRPWRDGASFLASRGLHQACEIIHAVVHLVEFGLDEVRRHWIVLPKRVDPDHEALNVSVPMPG